MALTVVMVPSTTEPKTVKPPFCVSRSLGSPPLSARLMNHWLVALLGSPLTLAIAIVPVVLEIPGSFWMAG